jgi:hypothetical protein
MRRYGDDDDFTRRVDVEDAVLEVREDTLAYHARDGRADERILTNRVNSILHRARESAAAVCERPR